MNYKVKIINNFLNKKDFKNLCKIKLKINKLKDFKVLHNEINNKKIIHSSISKKFLKTLHQNYFEKALKILKILNPKKVDLYDYSDFSIIATNKNSKFPIHDDTPNKLLSGVIYLYPKKNTGTIFYNTKKKNGKVVKWKQNRAVFFSRAERETWHSYEGDGVNDRVVLVYNLMTRRVKEVFKIEKKNYFIGNIRYKINPYLHKIFNKTI